MGDDGGRLAPAVCAPRGRARRWRRWGRLRRRGLQVVAVIAAGGVCGAAARYGLGVAWPHDRGGWPWATWLINVSGCLLIGGLMVYVVDVGGAHRLLRPFLGVGVLGGYTTFSTYAVDARMLVAAGRPGLAVGYLGGTAVAAMAAVQLGITLTRAVAVPETSVRKRRGGSR